MKVRTDTRAGSSCYTVVEGDNLSKIADKFYGNMEANSVAKIYSSNLATVGDNPNVIYPGQKLYIPD